MQASRALLSVQSSALKGLYIPQRTGGEVLLSAGQACVSFFSRENRDKFLDLANGGIINPQALGVPLSLALFTDLGSPLFDMYKFKIQDFASGVKIALENFHRLQIELENEISSSETGKSAINISEGESETDETSASGAIVVPDEKMLDEMSKELSLKFKSRAGDDTDSLPGQLLRMVTPEYFEDIIFGLNAQNVISKMHSKKTSNMKREITNITLLSARSTAIPPPPATEEEYEKMNEEEKETNDKIINNIYMEHPAVVQIEVLYQMQTTYTIESDSDNVRDNNGKELSHSNELVGVFEGWIFGRPEGLQWKLTLNRPFYGL